MESSFEVSRRRTKSIIYWIVPCSEKSILMIVNLRLNSPIDRDVECLSNILIHWTSLGRWLSYDRCTNSFWWFHWYCHNNRVSNDNSQISLTHLLLSSSQSLYGFNELTHLGFHRGHIFPYNNLALLPLIHEKLLITTRVVWMSGSQLDRSRF